MTRVLSLPLAFAHHKFIGTVLAAAPLVKAAGVEPDEGFLDLTTASAATAFLDLCAALRHWDRDVRA